MTSLAVSYETESVANPLDLVEQVITANDWAFDRRSDAEMAAEAPGKWCDYGLFFCWSHEISVMHFSCAFDLKAPEKRRAALYELLALANEKLWIGHFGIDQDDGMPIYRHSVLLRGAPSASAESRSPNASGFSRPSSLCYGAASPPRTRWRRRCLSAWGKLKRKRFFFEKKQQKTFAPGRCGTALPQPPANQSLFASFCSQKEVLTSC
jgi:hypothetical protein